MELGFFTRFHVKNEFIVDLEKHATLEAFFYDRLLDTHHCDLDHVGGGTLDRHVDGVAFRGGADGAVSRS
jgi:hypothetical protein